MRTAKEKSTFIGCAYILKYEKPLWLTVHTDNRS